MSKYCGKTITLNKNGVKFTAIVADTCSDSDCDGCCSKNAKNGYLVDIEYYTALRNLGGTGKVSGTIDFSIN